MAIEDEVEVKLGIEERLEKIGRLLDVCLAAPAAVLAKLIRELDDHALPLQSLHRSSAFSRRSGRMYTYSSFGCNSLLNASDSAVEATLVPSRSWTVKTSGTPLFRSAAAKRTFSGPNLCSAASKIARAASGKTSTSA